MSLLGSNRKINIAFVVIAAIAYLAITLGAPMHATSNQFNLPVWAIIFITLTILGLWLTTCFYGLYAWLVLDSYAGKLSNRTDRQAFGRIASGVRLLVYTLLVSSLFTGLGPYLKDNQLLAAIVSQVNNYIFLVFPFLGFLWLRLGTKKLAVTAQASLSLWAKFMTIGPPVVVLASFYVFLVVTNPTPAGPLVPTGLFALVALPVYIGLVVGSWIWGLLAALNVERATHGGSVASTKSLVKLYNGILVMTGGFIILDALSSLGTARIANLPLGVDVVLLYSFIAVICLGFVAIASAGRALNAEIQENK